VIVVRGRGRVLLGGESHDLEPLDVVYVSPETVHQFQAGADEPLGFLCIVDRDRDRPRPA
jgi:quercetin dioxygenase-like cupin family protein